MLRAADSAIYEVRMDHFDPLPMRCRAERAILEDVGRMLGVSVRELLLSMKRARVEIRHLT